MKSFLPRNKFLNYKRDADKKNNFMAPFYGWGSAASKLEPLPGGSLLFTITTKLLR